MRYLPNRGSAVFPLVSVKKKKKRKKEETRARGRFAERDFCLCCFLRRGFVALENRTFVIEPVRRHGNDTHLVYRVEKLAMTQGDCGHGFNLSSVPSEDQIRNPFRFFRARVRHRSLSSGCVQPWSSQNHISILYFLDISNVTFDQPGVKPNVPSKPACPPELECFPEGVALGLTRFICT